MAPIIQGCLPEGFTLRVRRSDESSIAVVGEADFILVATTPLSAEVIAAAPRLKLIQYRGVRYDNVDMKAATQAGIPVGLTPEGTRSPMAEHVIMLILSRYRNLFVANRTLRRGQWLQGICDLVPTASSASVWGSKAWGASGVKWPRARAFEPQTGPTYSSSRRVIYGIITLRLEVSLRISSGFHSINSLPYILIE